MLQMLLVRRERGLVFPQKISKRFEKVTRGTVEAYSACLSNKTEFSNQIFILLVVFFGRKLSQT